MSEDDGADMVGWTVEKVDECDHYGEIDSVSLHLRHGDETKVVKISVYHDASGEIAYLNIDKMTEPCETLKDDGTKCGGTQEWNPYAPGKLCESCEFRAKKGR